MRTLHLLNLLWVLLLGIFIPEKRVSAEVLKDSLETNQSDLQRLWVDSVFDALSFEERLGQLFMVAAYSNKDQRHVDKISALIQKENLGGLIFFSRGA